MVQNFKKNQKLFSSKSKATLQDLKVWKKIRETGYEWAAVRLCRGYAFLCQVNTIKVSSWSERICISLNQDVYTSEEDRLLYLSSCRKDYLDWADKCEAKGISHLAAMDILYFGENCKFVERKYCHRHGWAMSNLIQSFEFYRK